MLLQRAASAPVPRFRMGRSCRRQREAYGVLAARSAAAATSIAATAGAIRHRCASGAAERLLCLALGVGTIIAVDIATASSRRAFELSHGGGKRRGAPMRFAAAPGVSMNRSMRDSRTSAIPVALTPIVEGYVDVGDETLQLVGIDPLCGCPPPCARRGCREAGAAAQRAAERRGGAR